MKILKRSLKKAKKYRHSKITIENVINMYKTPGATFRSVSLLMKKKGQYISAKTVWSWVHNFTNIKIKRL